MALGVLTQPKGPSQQLIGYLNKEQDLGAHGWPACLQAVAAAALLVPEATKLTMGQQLGQVREKVLENRAAIDYLLHKHNQGCEIFKGLCCFNLSDNSQLIKNKFQQIHNIVSNIKQRTGFFGIDLSFLTSWLPSLEKLEEAFLNLSFIHYYRNYFMLLPQCISACRPAFERLRWPGKQHCPHPQSLIYRDPLQRPLEKPQLPVSVRPSST